MLWLKRCSFWSQSKSLRSFSLHHFFRSTIWIWKISFRCTFAHASFPHFFAVIEGIPNFQIILLKNELLNWENTLKYYRWVGLVHFSAGYIKVGPIFRYRLSVEAPHTCIVCDPDWNRMVFVPFLYWTFQVSSLFGYLAIQPRNLAQNMLVVVFHFRDLPSDQSNDGFL